MAGRRRVVARALGVLVLLAATLWSAGPAQAETITNPFTWSASGGLAMKPATSGVVRGATPTVMRSTALWCRTAPNPTGCAVGVGAAIAAVGVTIACTASEVCTEVVIPWVTNKVGGPQDGSTTGPVAYPCGVTSWESIPQLGGTYGQWLGFRVNWSGEGNPNSTSTCNSAGTMEIGWIHHLTGQPSYCSIDAPVSISQSTGSAIFKPGTGSCAGFSISAILTMVRFTPKGWHLTTGPEGEGMGNGLFWEASGAVEATTTVTCRRPDGTTYERTVNTPDAKEAVRLVQCDATDVPTRVRIDTNVGGVPKTTWEQPLDPTPQERADYPLCAGAACGYRVVIDGQTCTAGVYPCTEWTKVARDSPSRVECYYGPYKVSIDTCYPFEQIFWDTEPRKVDEPNTDGDPDTYSPPGPVTQPSPSPTLSPSPSPTVTAKPTPTVAPTPVPGHCASPYNLGPVMPQTAALANQLGPMFDIGTVGGYREADAYPDHPSGLAADFMVGTDSFTGSRLAAYAQQNAASLGVDYVMWDRKIWSQARAGEGWRTVADRGSPTANHEDHVHVTMLPVSGSVPCSAAGQPPSDSGSSGECFPTGWGMFNPAEWVLKPIRCAFIPDAAVITAKLDALDASWAGTQWASWLDAVKDVVSVDVPTDAGCLGPSMHLDVEAAGLDKTFHPYSTCDAPMDWISALMRGGLSAAICVSGAMACVRLLMAGFNYQTDIGKGA